MSSGSLVPQTIILYLLFGKGLQKKHGHINELDKQDEAYKMCEFKFAIQLIGLVLTQNQFSSVYRKWNFSYIFMESYVENNYSVST